MARLIPEKRIIHSPAIEYSVDVSGETMDVLKHTDKRFCVYSFSDSDGIIYYIGSGSLERPYIKSGRNKELTTKINSDCKVNILHDNLTRSEAFEIENKILTDYFSGIRTEGFNLLNKSKKSTQRQYSYSFFVDLFYYDPTSPTFLRWKVDRYGTGKARIVKENDVAGYVSKDYAYVSVDYVSYSVHRIIYSLLHKTDISNDYIIDHIDGDMLNNSIDNLQMLTQQENMKKKKPSGIQSNNISGVPGVYKLKTAHSVYWVCSYVDKTTGKRKTHNFNIKKYGDETAFLIACKLREQKQKENNGYIY